MNLSKGEDTMRQRGKGRGRSSWNGRGGGNDGGRRRGRGGSSIGGKPVTFVDESYKIRIEQVVRGFVEDDSKQSHTFDATLTKDERKYVHELCKLWGLLSKSRGKGANRQLTISKKSVREQSSAVNLDVCTGSLCLLEEYFAAHPLEGGEELKSRNIRPAKSIGAKARAQRYSAVGKEGSFSHHEDSLPIVEKREEILSALREAEVLVITGETGCGKSTQVPQYILGESVTNRVICTQPRRLSAVSLADRVAEENGTEIGGEVGYSIRLEKQFGSQTRLLFCTTGVLLRNLALSGHACLSGITHVIIDEVHERDCNSDFLLILIREMLRSRRGLFKVVLMSATLKVDDFVEYFEGFECRHIHAEGKAFPVRLVFLEDVLDRTKYVDSLKRLYPHFKHQLDSISATHEDMDDGEDVSGLDDGLHQQVTFPLQTNGYRCASCGKDGMTAVELGQHAAVCGTDMEDGSALLTSEWTQTEGWEEAEEEGVSDDGDKVVGEDEVILQEEATTDKSKSHLALLLKQYQFSRQLRRLDDDLSLDPGLVIAVLEYIHNLRDDLNTFGLSVEEGERRDRQRFKGAVLVFVSGWSDIVLLQEQLESHHVFGNPSQCAVHCLHSGIATKNQRKVFDRAPKGIRKIIVATNIAETSLTINDVVYVVDAGHHKEKDYDSRSKVSSLVVKYISKASATQRSGRAGRCQSGVCFRLYSKERHSAFAEETVPEMCRCSLEELSLQTSMILARPASAGFSPVAAASIEDFLDLALSKPDSLAVENAVELLKQLGALTSDGIITDLGVTVAKLPVSPSLAKALLVGCQLGCEDDILILCAFSMSPFTIAQTPELERKQREVKAKWGGCWSDHMALINLYKEWKQSDSKRQFCKALCVSTGVMNNVDKMVSHLRRSVHLLTTTNARLCHFPKRKTSPLTLLSLFGVSCAPNIAMSAPSAKTFTSGKERGIKLHRDSSLQGTQENLEFVVFEEISRSKATCTIRNCSFVLPICLILIAATSVEVEYQDDVDEEGGVEEFAIMRIGHGISFRVDIPLADALMALRTRFARLFHKTIVSRSEVTEEEQATIRLLHDILWEESRDHMHTLSALVEASENTSQGTHHRRNYGGRGREQGRGRGRGRGRCIGNSGRVGRGGRGGGRGRTTDGQRKGLRGRGRGRRGGSSTGGSRGNFRGSGRGRH